jgi:hypothetical protein
VEYILAGNKEHNSGMGKRCLLEKPACTLDVLLLYEYIGDYQYFSKTFTSHPE